MAVSLGHTCHMVAYSNTCIAKRSDKATSRDGGGVGRWCEDKACQTQRGTMRSGRSEEGLGWGRGVMVRMLWLRDDIPQAKTRANRNLDRNKGMLGVHDASCAKSSLPLPLSSSLA